MLNDKESFKEAFLEKLQVMRGNSIEESSNVDKYMALAQLVRDNISRKWVATNNRYLGANTKQVYYFSLEFLLGKALEKDLIYLGIRDIAENALKELGVDLQEIMDIEPDAGLGNGGLGRLAACFLDSMASTGLPGHGCGIRYKYGLFEQKIVNGYQVELPDNWLQEENVWEIKKYNKSIEVKFGGNVRIDEANGRTVFIHENYDPVLAVPYDIPIAGYRNNTVNTLRLWSAEAAKGVFDFNSFSKGDYTKAIEYKYSVEAISEVLYPDDSNYSNRILRLKQQYFFVSAGIQSIIRRFNKKHGTLDNLPEKVAIHINDTHPALAVAELMRILVDDYNMDWNKAWKITVDTISYTNHTIMPEALETWPVEIFKSLLPRIWMIINEINERTCKILWEKYPGDWDKIARMAIIAEDKVKMANLAIVGSHSINGVAAVHTEILKKELFRDFYENCPGRFNNKTNGITHRRWLLKANPLLSDLISEAIGKSWIEHPMDLVNLIKYSHDTSEEFQDKLARIKTDNKISLSKFIKERYSIIVDPASIFDVQIKRIHAYKRQLLKVFHIMDQYNRFLDDPTVEFMPRTYIFSGKAAPSYYYAKNVIKLINSLADKINSDKRLDGRMKIVFMENYCVSLAERIFPASDISEQISTASKEASGTGNMKFMMNGAITVGTLDGANIEIRNEVGDENIITFGLQVAEVLSYYKNGGYTSWDLYNSDHRLKRILDQMINDFLPNAKRDEFYPIYQSLLQYNDEFFVLKDFDAYINAQQKVDNLYKDKSKWLRMSINNIARSGKFSSDETINQYANEIWDIKP